MNSTSTDEVRSQAVFAPFSVGGSAAMASGAWKSDDTNSKPIKGKKRGWILIGITSDVDVVRDDRRTSCQSGVFVFVPGSIIEAGSSGRAMSMRKLSDVKLAVSDSIPYVPWSSVAPRVFSVHRVPLPARAAGCCERFANHGLRTALGQAGASRSCGQRVAQRSRDVGGNGMEGARRRRFVGPARRALLQAGPEDRR